MYFPIWEHESFRSLAGINTLIRIDARLREFMEGEYDQYEQLKRDFVLEFAAYLKPFDISLGVVAELSR